MLIVALCSTGSLAAGGESVVLTKTYSGNIDYLATGNSFRTSNTPGEQCFFSSPMESTVVVNIPIGVTILDAFLYFAGSGRIDNLHGAGSTLDLVDQTNLKLNGVSIPTSAGSNGRDFAHVIFTAGGNADFFGARRDVSDIVTSSGAYTLSGLVVDLHSDGRPNGSPAWST
ncbi:MAG: hypothetical protein ABGY96_13540 [bacterium]|nr:hypothetical protein [Gammaproteobacteria bacterium]HIL95370.1 hypothetical protein [Pseudomonadales bacterium]